MGTAYPTTSVIRDLESRAASVYGIPTLLLMENAGRGVAEFLFHHERSGRVTVVAGTGNNGGDGFVAARHLSNKGFSVGVLLVGSLTQLRGDAALNASVAKKMAIPILEILEATPEAEIRGMIGRSEIILDALFGIGLNKPVTGIQKTVIEAVNQHPGLILAVDIPSGIQADTGEVLGVAVQATHTATLAVPKRGLFQGAGPQHAGQIFVVDIGIPRELLRPFCA
ncbi:MAG: NAD(P)H-hydrate epimerase [Candidatus Omnitrophota bacterium]